MLELRFAVYVHSTRARSARNKVVPLVYEKIWNWPLSGTYWLSFRGWTQVMKARVEERTLGIHQMQFLKLKVEAPTITIYINSIHKICISDFTVSW